MYLNRILTSDSNLAKVLKVADRISNLTDINTDIFGSEFIQRYLNETEEFVLPMAREVNDHMATELSDLLHKRRQLIYKAGGSDTAI